MTEVATVNESAPESLIGQKPGDGAVPQTKFSPRDGTSGGRE
jgi:hypothetical protein